VDDWRFALLELRGRRRWLELALLSLNVGLWAAAIALFDWQWLGIFIGSLRDSRLDPGMCCEQVTIRDEPPHARTKEGDQNEQ
jgi:hypothetical protein